MSHTNNAVLVLISRLLAAIEAGRRHLRPVLTVLALFTALAGALQAQERPYFVTYSHDLEEPDNLEIEQKNVAGSPAHAGTFVGSVVEFEYGATAWWTTEFYLSGQSTRHDSTIFTGFRWENRFRPLMGEHWINPVLYIEFEDLNGADKSLLEVVGHDTIDDLSSPNAESRQEKEREMELKLILSRNWRGWNFSENTIFEKNLSNSPWEFGYAAAVSRPLSLVASPNACSLCAENFAAGLEMYGGLGDRYTPGLHNTSHYLSPTLGWSMSQGATFTFGPGFGLNDRSAGALFRFGVSAEIPQLLSHFRRSAHQVAR